MRALFLLVALAVVVVVAEAQRGGSAGGFFRPRTHQRRPSNRRPRPQQQQVSNNVGGRGGDDVNGNSEYHYSWRHNRGSFTGGQARSYCNGLGGGWRAISINSQGEDDYINRVIRGERLEYIWTSGQKRGRGWGWDDGNGVAYNNWSHTGGARRAQPDNRDRAGENCLAVLNNFYNDGVKWHDVACHHRKPVICERSVRG